MWGGWPEPHLSILPRLLRHLWTAHVGLWAGLGNEVVPKQFGQRGEESSLISCPSHPVSGTCPWTHSRLHSIEGRCLRAWGGGRVSLHVGSGRRGESVLHLPLALCRPGQVLRPPWCHVKPPLVPSSPHVPAAPLHTHLTLCCPQVLVSF